MTSTLLDKHDQLVRRNHNLDEDPIIGFQAEHTMIRIERRMQHGRITHCAVCGQKIPPKRLEICPETIWCIECVEEYDRRRNKHWTRAK